MDKCRFHNVCPYFSREKKTCNDKNFRFTGLGDIYCGKYRSLKKEYSKKQKKQTIEV
jgi:hypothetical protein